MTARPKRTRTKAKATSKESEIEVVQAAMQPFVIPPHAAKHLSEDAKPFFDDIIAEFARADWTDHTITLAVMLAIAIHKYFVEESELEEEGTVIITDRGNRAMNPRRSALQMHSGTIMNLRRTLALHATAGQKAQNVGRTRAIRKANEDDLPDQDDDLIGRPTRADAKPHLKAVN